MKYGDLRKRIKSAFLFYERLGLTSWDRFPNQSSLGVSNEFRKKALASGANYEDVYKAALSSKHFNFILADYSFFQFSAVESGVHCSSIRYSYYPNPYEALEAPSSVEREMSRERELIESVAQYYDEAKIVIGRPLVRYDLDRKSYRAFAHPAGHLHISTYQACRVPVYKVLCPFVFALFIAKHFYNSEWETVKSETDGSDLEKEYSTAYQALDLLDGSLFETREKLQPHLA